MVALHDSMPTSPIATQRFTTDNIRSAQVGVFARTVLYFDL